MLATRLALSIALACFWGASSFGEMPTKSELMRQGIGDWCYSPIGTITSVERRDFVNFVVEAGKKAQERYGVPGAIIAAMAIQESGYGRTRLAILSNNLLSFKMPADPAWRFGRSSFVLWCQPAYDKGNKYLHFENREAAFDYVAKVFAERQSLRTYFQATQQYKKSVSLGVDRKEAGVAWLRSIAPTYTEDRSYVDRILSYAANPEQLASPHLADSLWERIN